MSVYDRNDSYYSNNSNYYWREGYWSASSVNTVCFWIPEDCYDNIKPNVGDYIETGSEDSDKGGTQWYYKITKIVKITSSMSVSHPQSDPYYLSVSSRWSHGEPVKNGYLLYVSNASSHVTEAKEEFTAVYSNQSAQWPNGATVGNKYIRILRITTTEGQYGEDEKATITEDVLSDILTRYDITGDSSVKIWGIGTTDGPVIVYKDWSLVTNGFWGGTFKLQKFDEDSGDWITIKTYTSPLPENTDSQFPSGSTAKNYTDSGSFDEPTKIRIISYDFMRYYPSGNSEEDQGTIDFYCEATTHSGSAKITGVSSDGNTAYVDVVKKFANTKPTTLWRKSAWTLSQSPDLEDVIGYPRAVTFFQDRLVFGGSVAEPQTVWMSNSGDYYSFDENYPVQDDDTIGVTLNSRQINPIEHFIPLKSLVVMTSGSEWVISSQGVMTPSDIQATPQGYRGCSMLEPIVIGNMILFVQQHGRRVRDLGYNYESDGYTGNDLTVMADHLLRGHSIVSWCYQQEPNSVLWVVRDDGLLLSLTYLKEHDVFAWSQHPTSGKVVSIACISNEVKKCDDVFMCVERNGHYCIEYMRDEDDITSSIDAYYVDSGVTVNVESCSGKITGLEGDYSRDWFYFNKERVLSADYTIENLSHAVTEDGTSRTQGVADGFYKSVKILVKNGKIVTTDIPTKLYKPADEYENAVSDDGSPNWSGFNGVSIPVLSDGIFYTDITLNEGTAFLGNIRTGYSAYALCSRVSDSEVPDGETIESAFSSDKNNELPVPHSITKVGIKAGTYDKVPFSIRGGKIHVDYTTTMDSHRMTALNGMPVNGNIPDGIFEGDFEVSFSFVNDSAGNAYAISPMEVTIKTTSVSSVGGLEHLDGMDAVILADGSVDGIHRVENGMISANKSAKVLHAGLPYTARMRTMDIVANREDGTSMGRKARIVGVSIKVENSRAIFAGTDENHLQESTERTSESYGSPTDLITDDIKLTLDSTYDSRNAGSYWIESLHPLPASIVALVPEISFGG